MPGIQVSGGFGVVNAPYVAKLILWQGKQGLARRDRRLAWDCRGGSNNVGPGFSGNPHLAPLYCSIKIEPMKSLTEEIKLSFEQTC